MSTQGSIKISVVGVGHVGSIVSFILATRGLAGEIVLCAREGEDETARGSQQRAAMEALERWGAKSPEERFQDLIDWGVIDEQGRVLRRMEEPPREENGAKSKRRESSSTRRRPKKQ